MKPTKNAPKKTSKIVYRTNLSGVPAFARGAILAQIARDEGMAITDIIVEGI
jgi:hypothetical protein